MDIKQKLERCADLRCAADSIRLRYAELRKSIIPQEFLDQLAELDAEERSTLELQETALATLEAEIKAEVLTIGESVKSDHMTAVYNKGRVTWDSKGLEGYAVAHPEIVAFRKEGDPTISLRSL